MSDFVTMRLRILDELANDGDLTDDQVKRAIKSAIQLYQRRTWWFNTQIVDFTVVAGTELYESMPGVVFENIVEIQTLQVNNGGLSVVRPMDDEAIDDVQDGSVTGQPQYYSRVTNMIRLYPIPDAAYPMEMTYTYKFDDLEDDTDTNAWMTEGEELIRQAAKRRLALDYLNADDIAARCATLEREAYSELMAENRRRWPNKTLRTPPMLSPDTFNIRTGF